MTPRFKGVINSTGKLSLHNKDQFRDYLRTMAGKVVNVTVVPVSKQRSDAQRGYYFAVIVPMLALETGFNREEVHDAMRFKFLRDDDRLGAPHAKSTNDLTTAEAEDYYEQIRVWAASFLRLSIPLPNEVEA